MTFLADLLGAIQVLSALALIGLVMMQTTKSEGLTGTIGGKMSSSFRGKPGLEDRLSDYTKWTAIAFFAASLLFYIASHHTGV